jgi:L-cysteine S-thiosulfotransferase
MNVVNLRSLVRPAVLAVTAAMALTACRTYPDYASDFRFPIQNGDVAQGREAFVRLGCPQCHTVEGEQLVDFKGTRFITMPLGGEVIFAKTYADLVTSIVNPNHVISEKYLGQLPAAQRNRANTSPMYMNPEMKVTELIDIVAFLNSRYSLLPGYTEYYY